MHGVSPNVRPFTVENFSACLDFSTFWKWLCLFKVLLNKFDPKPGFPILNFSAQSCRFHSKCRCLNSPIRVSLPTFNETSLQTSATRKDLQNFSDALQAQSIPSRNIQFLHQLNCKCLSTKRRQKSILGFSATLFAHLPCKHSSFFPQKWQFLPEHSAAIHKFPSTCTSNCFTRRVKIIFSSRHCGTGGIQCNERAVYAFWRRIFVGLLCYRSEQVCTACIWAAVTSFTCLNEQPELEMSPPSTSKTIV